MHTNVDQINIKMDRVIDLLSRMANGGCNRKPMSREATDEQMYLCGVCGCKRGLWNAYLGLVPRGSKCEECGDAAAFVFERPRDVSKSTNA